MPHSTLGFPMEWNWHIPLKVEWNVKWNRAQFVVMNNVTKTMSKFQTFLGHNCEHCTLLHIVPFCEGPNKKLEGFAKKKQLAIFAMRHASHLVVHHPSLIYNVPYNHRNTFATYTTNKILRPTQSPSTLAIFHTSQRSIIFKTSHILQYKKYR